MQGLDKAKEARTMSEPTLSHSSTGTDVESESRRRFTRREFMYFAGIGAASLALSSPISRAFALQPDETDDLSAATIAEAAASDRIVGWLHWNDDMDTATPFVFEPSFFNGGAMTYNGHLATFGCCVALAAMNAEENGGANHSYANMHRNIRSLMHQVGVEDGDVKDYSYQCDGTAVTGRKAGNVAWNSAYEKKPSYDLKSNPKSTIGLCLGHRKIKVEGQDYNLVMLGIRGGYYEMEWCSNVTVGASGNHEGFQEAADTAARFLKCHIREWGLTGPTKILINGFSRAGATTNLTAGTIVKYAIDHGAAKTSDKEGYDLSPFFGGNVKVRQCDLYGYGYEAPAGVYAVSNDAKAAAKNNYGNIHSIINPCDLVPKVAPAAWDFKRYGVDKMLPGPMDRSRYLRGRDKMLDRLHALGLHRKEQFTYTLDTFPAIDYEFLKGTGAKFEKFYDMKTLDLFIEEFITLLAKEVFHTRVKGSGKNELPGYADTYQTALISAMQLYNEIAQDSELNAKGADGESPMTKFAKAAMDSLLNNVTSMYLQVILNYPLTCIIEYVDKAMEQTKLNAKETMKSRYGKRIVEILEALLTADYVEHKALIGLTKCSTLSRFIHNHTKEVIAFGMKASVAMSAHRSELCLSWLQSRDNYYAAYGKEDLPDAPETDPLAASTTATTSAAAIASNEAAAEDAAASAAVVASASDAAASMSEAVAEDAAAGGGGAGAAGTGAASASSQDADSQAATADPQAIEGAATTMTAANEKNAARYADGDIAGSSDAGNSNAADATSPASASGAGDENAATPDNTATAAAAVPAASTVATLSATDEGEDAYEDDDPSTYRKIFFNGGKSISYVVGSASYQIFKDGRAVFADDDNTPISVEGRECPFLYGLDSDLQQAVYLPDSANLVDGGTDYIFSVTTEPDAPLKCTAARCNASDGFPESLYIYESATGCFSEPLQDYTFTVKLNELAGSAYSASRESGETFRCDFETAGVTSTAQATSKVEEDSNDVVVARYYDIDSRTANAEAGGTIGGGMSLRGTISTVEAVPFDGYEFDHWSIDDKWMVDGKEASSIAWSTFTTDDEGNLVRHDPEEMPEGEWVEGERKEGEIIEGAHVYRIVANDDHMVTAHFKAATPSPEPAADPNANGGGNTTAGNAGQTQQASKAKTTPKTGDASPAVAVVAATVAAAAGAAGAAAMKATKKTAVEDE